MADRSRSTYRFFTYPDQRRRSVPEPEPPEPTTIYRRGVIAFACGFEDATVTSHNWEDIGGVASLDSTIAGRTGTNALRLDLTNSAVQQMVDYGLGLQTVVVRTFRFRFSALPTGDTRVAMLEGTVYDSTLVLTSTGTLTFTAGGTSANSASPLVPNVWYGIDLAIDGTNKIARWSINGVAQTNPGDRASTETINILYFGKSNLTATGVTSFYYDDVAFSSTFADYPIGPGSVQKPYASAVLADSPVAYWQLGEASGNPQDSSGNAHHVTVVGGTPTYGQTGPIAGTTAIAFDGTTEFFTVPSGIDVADVFTLEAWVIPGATGASRGIICLSDGQYLRILNTGALTLSQESVGILSTSTIVVPAGGWHHVVATKNGATVKLYIDGVDRTGTVTNQTHVSFAGLAHIGEAGSAVERFNGSIGQAAVYNTALSATQVAAHYASAPEAWFQGFTADAVISAGGVATISGSFTANAVIRKTMYRGSLGIVFACGGEAASEPGTSSHWSAVSGSVTKDTAHVRSESNSLKFVTTAGGATVNKTISAGNRSLVLRFAVYVTSVPASGQHRLWEWNAGGFRNAYLDPDGKIYLGSSGSTSTLPLNQWVVIDFRLNSSANPHTYDWSINGVAQTQGSEAIAAADVTNFFLGDSGTSTATWWVDDLAFSVTAANYPIGPGSVQKPASTEEWFQGFTANAVIKRTWGGARYSSLIGAHGPVAYWRLGEPSGTTATAAVGPNGTYQNTPTLGVAGLLTGDPNTAVTFDPASAEAVGISTGMPAGSSVGASVEMWLNTAASLPAFEIWTLWSRGDIAGPNHTFRYRRWDDATTSLFWLFWDGSTAQSVYSVTWATHTAGLAGRHHIAMVHDYAGQTVKAYVDGVLAGTGSASAFGTPVAPAANASSRIAGYMGNDVFMFPGTMDEVAVYDSILSATQILAHYQSGAGTSSSFTADAVFAAGLATVSGSFTANAAKKATISGSLTANAVIKATLAGSFTANAVKKSTVAGSFTANAALRKTISGTFLADAVKRSTVVGSLTANAVIRKTISGSLAADAVIKRTQTGSTTANAVKRATVSGSTTANAVLFKATQPGTFTADASKVRTTTGTFAADAAKLKTISGSFTANATLRKTIAGSFVADAVKRATVSGSFTANGAIKRTQTSSFTANAAIKATLSGSTTANAVKFRANQLGSLTADAVKRQTFSGSWTADATLKRTQAGSVTANAVVFRAQTGSFTANTRIMPVFAADAIIRRTQTGSFAGSAVIMPVFRADAVIKVAQAGSFTAGSFVAGVGFAAIGADAIRFRRGPDYSAEVLADTPVAYWPLGEASGNPQDSTANGHNVTVVNGTPTYGVTGPVSGTTAVAFNGTTDSFTAPNDPGFDVGDVFTLEAWVIPGPFVGSRGVLCLGGGQYLRIINTGELTLSWASVGIIVRSTILMPTTGWHHIVATKSGSTVKLYIDGVDRTGTVTDLTFGSFAGVLHIAEGNGGVERFNGSIGQVALYGSALSPVRVLAHYVVGTTAPGALTADAVKLKAASGSFTAQAVNRVTIASSFTASAVVKRTATATFTADAVFIRARAGSFTADAIRRRTQTGAFTGDAIRRSTTTGSIAASAVLRKTILPTFTVDSVVLKARTGTFAANAVVLKVQVATVAADAVLKATRTSSFSMAAIIARAGSGSFTADAYILSPTAGANTFFADAIVKASRAGSFTASANLVKSLTGSLTANAVKFKAQSGTFAVDATLRKTASGTFTADATKLKTIAGSFTANAWKIRVVSSSRTADAVIRRTQAGSLVADAVIRRSQAGSFTADARRAQTATGSFTASALVRLSQFGTLPISAVLRGPRSASFTADAWITKIVSASFTASAWTVATRTAGFATAATIRRQQTQTFTADAVRRASRAGVTTADATTRRTASASITADASIAGAGQNSFKVDAVKRESFEGSLTADAFFDDGKRAGDFTADAVFDVLRPSFPLTSTLTVAKMTAQIDAPHLGSSLSVERLSSIIVAPHLSASVGSVHLQSWLGWSRTTGSFTASAVIA